MRRPGPGMQEPAQGDTIRAKAKQSLCQLPLISKELDGFLTRSGVTFRDGLTSQQTGSMNLPHSSGGPSALPLAHLVSGQTRHPPGHPLIPSVGAARSLGSCSQLLRLPSQSFQSVPWLPRPTSYHHPAPACHQPQGHSGAVSFPGPQGRQVPAPVLCADPNGGSVPGFQRLF